MRATVVCSDLQAKKNAKRRRHNLAPPIFVVEGRICGGRGLAHGWLIQDKIFFSVIMQICLLQIRIFPQELVPWLLS